MMKYFLNQAEKLQNKQELDKFINGHRDDDGEVNGNGYGYGNGKGNGCAATVADEVFA